jgi:hypothetical protein
MEDKHIFERLGHARGLQARQPHHKIIILTKCRVDALIKVSKPASKNLPLRLKELAVNLLSNKRV